MLFRYPSAAATHLADCCIVRLRTTSTGVALSSPQDCRSLITTNITAANAAIGSAGSMAPPASGESPLDGFMAVPIMLYRIWAFAAIRALPWSTRVFGVLGRVLHPRPPCEFPLPRC